MYNEYLIVKYYIFEFGTESIPLYNCKMLCVGMWNWMYNEYLIVKFYVEEFETECIVNI